MLNFQMYYQYSFFLLDYLKNASGKNIYWQFLEQKFLQKRLFLNFRIVINNTQEHFEHSCIITLIQGYGAHILVPIMCVLSAYFARTLHMLWHILLDVSICFGTYSSMFWQIREICRREVCENFPRPRSSTQTLVYRHRHLFSCDFFAHENILRTK